MKIYIQTNKATTNIFGIHTQPRKTTRYTNKLKLAFKEKEPSFLIKKYLPVPNKSSKSNLNFISEMRC